MTYKTITLEKEVPVEWPDGTTKLKISLELPCPPITPEQVKEMGMDIGEIMKGSYQITVDALARYLQMIQYSGDIGALNGIPLLNKALLSAGEELNRIFQANVKSNEKWR